MLNNISGDLKRELETVASKNKFLAIFECICNQGFQAVLAYRICRFLKLKHIPLVGMFIQRFIEITTSISIPAKADIGEGLLIYHFGGIIINADSKIGKNCTLHHGVTIGNKTKGGGSPKIGNDVYIGAGAKILGEIAIGDNCKIGANAVVIQSIPSNSTDVGIPAKIIND